MEKIGYNATVVGRLLITPDLMILRIRGDEPRRKFKAGQYTKLGLLGRESRSGNSVMVMEEGNEEELITRPYSIASADDEGSIFEFYISQVKSGQLTPRLFDLSIGGRIWLDKKILGIFTLNETPAECDIVMLATGTGLAPYISFLRSHINEHKNIKLVVIHGAAYSWDLGYYSELTFINKTFKNFYYFPTILKGDDSWTGLTGYIEEHLNNGLLEKEAGIEVKPMKTHFYLCGNPNMVEVVSEYLYKKNYTKHTSKKPGALHTEEY